MIVRHLSLTDFRNYAAAEVALEPGANLFVGRNGQGKTNLVESLGYLATLGSHRVSTDQALIRAGQDAAIVRARLEHEGRELLVELQLNRSSANRAQVNRAAIKPRELPRYVSTVLFAPEDLALVRGEPSTRRRFLDALLGARSPRLFGVFADYDRVLKQRNALLKSARAQGLRSEKLSTLELWNERLVELGSEIITERLAIVASLEPFVREAYQGVAGSDQEPALDAVLSILAAHPEADDDADAPGESTRNGDSRPMLGRAEIADAFRTALERVARAERDRAITLVGPHRDDLLLTLNGLPAKGYASHGESWSFALALKLASAELLRADSSTGDPVVILDDVFAELDQRRRGRLADAVKDYQQVLITAAVLEDVPEALTAHTVRIEAGTIVESSTIAEDLA
ncbi:DNA replication/repair protein RecF [Herbiconiux sp. CPCC 203407]|uniref:DNA replication and repair protein RecF n=1 Tax=Herbiconiux oxytropis TaxID=2970915 RepID=A0AA41XBS7_9MICO|nr:DNA replication/repair protein RecF [Herbiconiux oxytropis]MCS5723193.1 DNA replication/repair protein RecF [Herbiconiux oxytropis]MCS5725132.1 DNA replication/repair protein RecF [Herbiconiux oxytropis]